MSAIVTTASVLIAAAIGAGDNAPPQIEGIDLFERGIPSSVDGSEQPVIIGVPTGYDHNEPTPLLVGLHTWSADYRQRALLYGREAAQRGWLMVLPDFRGPNTASNPHARQAGGSIIAQRDIVDARGWMVEDYNVDLDRVFITGDSGGGHMTLLMAAKHPELWSAAAAWVPVSDLREWWETRPDRRDDLRAITGGEPGESPEMDLEYMRRSPRTFMTNLAHLPVLLGHGDNDRLIPVEQSYRTFRALKDLRGHNTLLHVFSGGHTGLQGFGLDWCVEHARPRPTPADLQLVTDESKAYYRAELTMNDESRLARAELVLGEGVLSVATENLRELGIDLSDLTLPESGMTLTIRSDCSLGLTLKNAPGGVQVASEREWWRVVGRSASGLTLDISASEETRALKLLW